MEDLGQACVGEEVLAPILGVRPGGIPQERLTPQLLGDAQALPRPEASDALAPICVLGLTRRAPVA